MLENSLAKPSSSPWSSPCLLAPKSNGTPRFCTDFRKVNAVTVPDPFPRCLVWRTVLTASARPDSLQSPIYLKVIVRFPYLLVRLTSLHLLLLMPLCSIHLWPSVWEFVSSWVYHCCYLPSCPKHFMGRKSGFLWTFGVNKHLIPSSYSQSPASLGPVIVQSLTVIWV